MSERFLVTGAMGCIGAWAVKRLVAEGVPVWTYDLPGEPHRLRLIMDDGALAKVNMIAGDITDDAAFGKAVADNGITHVIHLAALQVPFVKANPLQGVKVNVIGTAVVMETLRRNKDQIKGFAYASSAGVYGPNSMYPDGVLKHDSPLYPTHLYGVMGQMIGLPFFIWLLFPLVDFGNPDQLFAFLGVVGFADDGVPPNWHPLNIRCWSLCQSNIGRSGS